MGLCQVSSLILHTRTECSKSDTIMRLFFKLLDEKWSSHTVRVHNGHQVIETRERHVSLHGRDSLFLSVRCRHGRLGIGEAATDNSLPFDQVDSNDTYIPRPTLLQVLDQHPQALDMYR
jgi:hypothetical protein